MRDIRTQARGKVWAWHVQAGLAAALAAQADDEPLLLPPSAERAQQVRSPPACKLRSPGPATRMPRMPCACHITHFTAWLHTMPTCGEGARMIKQDILSKDYLGICRNHSHRSNPIA